MPPGELDMRALGGEGQDGVAVVTLKGMLTPLVDAYQEWIDHLEAEVFEDLTAQVGPQLEDTAREHLERCRLAAARIRQGIALLEDDAVRRAFCFANRAMALQRERTVIALARRRGEEPPFPAQVGARWRPFQIAFILINLPGVARRDHHDRGLADLLWFPTGGGKTEAYLGLTAFMLAHRRTRAPLDGPPDRCGRLRPHALHAPTAHDPAVPAGHRTDLRLRAPPPRRRASVGERAVHHRALGRTECDAEQPTEATTGPRTHSLARRRTARAEGQPRSSSSLSLVRGGSRPENYRADDDREQIFVTCSDEDCDYSPGRNGMRDFPSTWSTRRCTGTPRRW